MKNVTTKMIKKVCLSLMVFCLLAVVGSASATLILQNGSFENPVIPTGNTSISEPTIPDWTVTGSVYWALFEGNAGGFPPVDGSQELYLYGGTLQQTLGVIASNTTYTVGFWAGINPGMVANYSEVVFIDATKGDRLAAINLSNVITGNTPSKWFYGQLTYNTATYPADVGDTIAVQVNSGTELNLDAFTIPEPVTVLLMAAGGLTLLRRKK